MSDVRTTRRDIDRQLQETWIVTDRTQSISDPITYLRHLLGASSDALVVIEETDRVMTVALTSLTVSERTLHLHAFSKSAKAQARVARTALGWVSDSVRECDKSATETRAVVAQDGRVMCLGDRTLGTNSFAEARIRPYELPVAGDTKQLDVAYRNYYEETASGRLACIAHRVIGFVAREVK